MPNKPAHENDPFKGIKTGAWTKYGGARQGLEHGKGRSSTWYCQSCGQEQPSALPGFLIEGIPGEYVKICASCFAQARRVEYSYTKVITTIKRHK